jgi:Nucleotidyltransferase domain
MRFRKSPGSMAPGTCASSVRWPGGRPRKAVTWICVEMETGRTLLDLVAIKQDLEEFLGCKVDVVTEAAISPYLRESVLSEAIRL